MKRHNVKSTQQQLSSYIRIKNSIKIDFFFIRWHSVVEGSEREPFFFFTILAICVFREENNSWIFHTVDVYIKHVSMVLKVFIKNEPQPAGSGGGRWWWLLNINESSREELEGVKKELNI